MVGTSKILTVSYGTFSCTLEGFDDSFSAMKAIAEYFRDLAADDRYFGAEPPTPDADMLARIAEKEVARRVEAQMAQNGDGVVLRPAAEAAAQISAPVADKTAEAPVAAPMDEAVEEAPADEAPAAPAPDSPTDLRVEADDDADSVAEKLARIRAVVDADGQADAESIYTEDEHAASFFAESAEDEVAEAPLAEAGAAEGDADAAEAEDGAEAEAPDEAADEPVLEDDQPEDVAADQNLAALIASTAAAPAWEGEAAEDAAETDADDADEDRADVEAAEAEAEAEEVVAEDDADDKAEADADEAAEDDAPQAAEKSAAPVRARIMKVDRKEFDRAVETDTVDEFLDAQEPIRADAAADATSLSDEDEADLMAELAEVEADVEAGLTEEERAQRRSAIDRQIDEDEESVDRLMGETDKAMESGEGSRRRAAIAHLKAAVAATKADRKSGRAEERDPDAEAAPYREDLAQVVQPRRREAGKAKTERPRPAPLMLVSEQRIDRPDDVQPAAAAASVAPRRVTKGNLAMKVDDEDLAQEEDINNMFSVGDFSDFVADTGAEGTQEVIEAAAAYACLVEGLQDVTRPSLMTAAEQIIGDDFNREDALRAFGTLLRQGKLKKVKRGHFIVTDATRFKP